ncbi:MAG TPA: DUF4349 domain-containing protein [Thermoanaerobaculia bacterium]
MKKLIALSLLLVVFACKAREGATASSAQSEGTDSVAAQRVANVAGAPAAPAMPRMIVRTANVSIIVRDTSEAVKAITERSEAAGGYVADSRIWRDGELLRATLTVRVPADRLTATLASIRTVAKRVENETVTSEDVSQEFVDLESQVRNLEATETELRQLLTTVREKAKRAADILEVHQQLTTIRSQIEQLRGRMRYLSQVSAMSSITLAIIPDAIAQPVVQPGWQPVVVARNAGRALVGALQAIANVAIWFIILGLPLALVAWLAARGITRVWKTRKSIPS